ncbi:MAG: redox-regulated ATPase YchF, partial [Actinobacteria bacterium]
MEIGIVGLPNVGKTTLFNALSKAQAQVGLYPFTTVDSNVGVVDVPDERLEKIASIIKPSKVIPAKIKFVDIAGLVEGASKGEGLGNQFLGHIRNVDGIIHLVRCFGENIPSVGKAKAIENVSIINLEIMTADLQIIEKRFEKAEKQAKAKDKEAIAELALLKKAKELLEKGTYLATAGLSEEEKTGLNGIGIISVKPVILVANVSEADESQEACFEELKNSSESLSMPVLKVVAKLEAELKDLSPEEAKEFLDSFGMSESSLNGVIAKTYEILGLITFYTVLSDEVRAWPVEKGTKAPGAAGKIHTDMEKGFIKAEVINEKELAAAGSMHEAKEEG